MPWTGVKWSSTLESNRLASADSQYLSKAGGYAEVGQDQPDALGLRVVLVDERRDERHPVLSGPTVGTETDRQPANGSDARNKFFVPHLS